MSYFLYVIGVLIIAATLANLMFMLHPMAGALFVGIELIIIGKIFE